MTRASAQGRGPKLIVLENVCGTLTSHGGKDFTAIAEALAEGGYRFGAMVINAGLFVPQSRPRLFVVAAASGVVIPEGLAAGDPEALWYTRALRAAYERLSPSTARQWLWWNMPTPPQRTTRLQNVIEEPPSGVEWHSPAETARLVGMMSARNLEKFQAAKKIGTTMVGTLYRRTRESDTGKKVQRAEIRFDGVAGCLRTASGGSSRQLILVVTGKRARSRLLSSREAARLMGLPDSYELPKNYNEAYHLVGDGVAVPVVRHLAEHIFEPILNSQTAAIHCVA